MQTTAKDWILEIPVDSKGKFDGECIRFPEANYQAPWFIAPCSFRTPVSGATTENSKYPRTELREKINGGTGYKALSEPLAMRVKVRVLRAPLIKDGTPGRIVIGQIHAKENEPLRIYYDNGAIYCKDENNKKKDESTYYPINTSQEKVRIPLGEWFEYAIHLQEHKLVISIKYANKLYTIGWDLKPYWKDAVGYIKAGQYIQCSPKGGTKPKSSEDFGLMEFADFPWLTRNAIEVAGFKPFLSDTPIPIPIPTSTPPVVPDPSSRLASEAIRRYLTAIRQNLDEIEKLLDAQKTT